MVRTSDSGDFKIWFKTLSNIISVEKSVHNYGLQHIIRLPTHKYQNRTKVAREFKKG